MCVFWIPQKHHFLTKCPFAKSILLLTNIRTKRCGLVIHQLRWWINSIIVYLNQLSRKLCYQYRQTKKGLNCTWQKHSSKIFLRKSCSENSGKFPETPSPRNVTFLLLHLDRQQIYKNCTSWKVFPWIFRTFSDQRFGSSMRGCHWFCWYKLEINRSV